MDDAANHLKPDVRLTHLRGSDRSAQRGGASRIGAGGMPAD